MVQLPMFYETIVPLSTEAHRGYRVHSVERPFAFAEKAYLIPAVVEEFAAAAKHLPVVFAQSDEGFTSVFLCGIKPGQNLFIDADGHWTGNYLPAYLRRYPFILGERSADDHILCIDGGYAGFNTDEGGEVLFEDNGEQSAFLGQMVRLAGDYATAARRTESLCTLLAELKIMRNITVDVKVADGSVSASVHGLMVVDEDKLNALSSQDFARIREQGVLGAVYAHLFSIDATSILGEKLEQYGNKDA
jgi:SapC